MKKRWISIILALMIAISLTACTRVVVRVPAEVLQLFQNQMAGGAPAANSADGYQAATQSIVTQPLVTQPTTAKAPAGNTPAANTTAANNGGANTTAAPAANNSTPAQNNGGGSGALSTKDEIVAYYVTAYNKIATDSKSITRTYDYTSNYKSIVDVGGNSTLAGIAKTLMDANMKEDKTEKPGTIQDVAPKGLTSISITPAQVSEATCKDNGTTYEITLKSTGTDENPELDCQPGQGSAGVIGPLLRTEDVEGGAGGMVKFEGLHAKYPQGKVTATVDKASGHITELKFDCPCILHFDKATAVVVTVNNTELGLEFFQTWVFTY